MEISHNTEAQSLNSIAYPESVNESKSAINPQVFLWALIAIVLYIIYSQQPDKNSTLCIIQLTLIAVCALLAVIKLFAGGHKLTYIPTGSLITREERFYSLSLESDIRQCLREGNIARINALKTNDAGGIMIESLKSKDKVFTAMRMQKYHFEGYIPETEWKVM